MEWMFQPISMRDVKLIDSWNYDDFIEQVSMKPYFHSFEETGRLIGPGGCEGFVVMSRNEAVGLFEYSIDSRILYIGLALNPSLTGKGLGLDFVRKGLEFGLSHYNQQIDEVRLYVDIRNTPAIRVYEKIGFEAIGEEAGDREMRLMVKGETLDSKHN
ncbi:GNAT family N-acetyltransferase [Bacillus sp. KH172YL63]|uniref:GNAT family N-acetyltransferase n=1 Tax=Bacillus sp. KH172YL63 TaxID=2709784 RepID=UPI0013E4BB85|nr:GNAT family N-acetyltransferase [Bacillus sp. KH172YL63]BCB04647.1 hypothetical protein KH172YL63_27800 [Bacillus sp. KH172YL63]